MKRTYVLCLILVTMIANANAALRDIRIDQLPSSSEARTAYATALKLETMVDHWSDRWTYPTPQSTVREQLTAAINSLKPLQSKSPDNLELTLLLGTIAHYGYNLDIAGTYEIAMEMFGKAETFAPGDLRGRWFKANHVCQTSTPDVGMLSFLEMESATTWDKLPQDFWDDYAACATVTNMPAHALRAIAYNEKLNAVPNVMRTFLVKANNQRFVAPTAATPDTQLWRFDKQGTKVRLGSYACGYSVLIEPDWGVGVSPMDHETCAVQLRLTAQDESKKCSEKSGAVCPTILIMARPARENETVEMYYQSLIPKGKASAAPQLPCPLKQCVRLEVVSKGQQGTGGDEIAWVVAFDKQAPEYSGLLLEEPTGPQPNSTKDGPQYFHPNERARRLNGRMLYIVMLHTSSQDDDVNRSAFAEMVKSFQSE